MLKKCRRLVVFRSAFDVSGLLKNDRTDVVFVQTVRTKCCPTRSNDLYVCVLRTSLYIVHIDLFCFCRHPALLFNNYHLLYHT